jgi:hypothetical protein
MGTLPLIAVASALWALPAFAEDGGNAIPSKPTFTLAQFDVCIGPDCRYYDRYDDDWRCLHVDNWHYYQGGVCRDVTIRDLCGDGVVRHVRRCD